MYSKARIWVFAALIANALSDDTTLKALEIPPSEYFEGNDGPWSTFDVRVGTPVEYIRVLVSTASPESIVVLSQYGCSTASFPTIPPDCAVSRGNLFNLAQSSSWHDVGNYGINSNGVGLEANLGYEQTADFGLEHLGIGLTGPALENQTVAGIATANPFYLGIFGLNNQPLNFSSLGNSSSPSFLTTLKTQGKIPSLSWSYTAGAKYRLKQVYGQLIFSGYDTSRFRENSVSFTMADDVTRDLVVALQSISYSGTTSVTLLSTPIDIFIDSTDPNIWLPADTCDAFEKAFGLTLDSKSGLYLINDTHHNALLDSNAEVTFRLSDVKSGGDSVAIVLPYAAFGLTAEYPLVENSSHYFPLKRANSSTQYTLGRTFLQEGYLTADYERKVFNVSACVWNQGAQENIITITSKDSSSNTTTGSSSSSGGSRLSGGAIAGIVIASVLVLLLAAAALTFCILRKRRKWLKQGFAATTSRAEAEPDEAILKGPVFNSGSRSTGTTGDPHSRTTPMSAADVSAPSRSTAEYSRSTADSPGRLVAVGESAAGTSTVELDGHQIRPDTELDGREIHPVAENPGVYELPGSGVAAGVSREGSDEGRTGEGEHSPPSPFTSTWGGDKGTSDLVSPSSPTRHGARPF